MATDSRATAGDYIGEDFSIVYQLRKRFVCLPRAYVREDPNISRVVCSVELLNKMVIFLNIYLV